MSTTNTPEQTNEACVQTWYGQHLERATVLNTAHIATVNAALTGIQAVVDVLHDRERSRPSTSEIYRQTSLKPTPSKRKQLSKKYQAKGVSHE